MGGFFNEITYWVVGCQIWGGGNCKNPLNALVEEIQQSNIILMGGLVYKTHSINYAASP